jgi:hypothetical protein
MNSSTFSDAGNGSNEMVIPDLPEEFAGTLESRTKVPPERIVEFLTWSDAELEQEAREIDGMRLRFQTILSRYARDPSVVDQGLGGLEVKSFSRDHNWRAILEALSEVGQEFREHKRMAIASYLQYLDFRRDLLRFITTRRRKSEAGSQGTRQERSLMGTIGRGVLKDTSAFDMPKSQVMPMASDGFVRLPQRGPVQVRVAQGEVAVIYLGSSRFELVGGMDLHLTDEKGVIYYLAEGVTAVGRHLENDVVVDPDYRDVSRFHLTIDWRGEDLVTLTDVSSLGTFISPAKLEA